MTPTQKKEEKRKLDKREETFYLCNGKLTAECFYPVGGKVEITIEFTDAKLQLNKVELAKLLEDLTILANNL